jgi:hypothetical protein
MDEPVLKNSWDADVPAHDARFVLAVMARAEEHRFHRELLSTVGLAALAMVLLALVMPALELTWRQTFAPDVTNLGLLGMLGALTLALPQLLPARD